MLRRLQNISSFALHAVIAFLTLGFDRVTPNLGVPLRPQPCIIATWVHERADTLGDLDLTGLAFLKMFPIHLVIIYTCDNIVPSPAPSPCLACVSASSL